MVKKGTTYRKAFEKIGRNEKCFCGSDKKYKNCCYEKAHDIYVEVRQGEPYERREDIRLRDNA